jgi:hypothetical protein
MKKPKILDVECYQNYFLISFKCVETLKYREFELYKNHPLDSASVKRIMQSFTTISFNGNSYDLAMISAALKGYGNVQLKKLSDELITSGKPCWMVCRNLNINIPKSWDHIDLIDVAPGKASLKIYGGRLNSKKLQDLPIEPDSLIDENQRDELRIYCRNDLDTTHDLLNDLDGEIKLRQDMSELYGVDLRSKGGAQVAKAVLQVELEKFGVGVSKNTVKAGTKFKYKMPYFISFKTNELKAVYQTVLDVDFVVEESGQVKMPKALHKAIEFDGGKYQFGIGGLHSQEKNQAIKCLDNQILADRDVASMYPNIILGQKLYPKHLTEKFCDVYAEIVARRLAAKSSGDKLTANSLKLVINSSFGLFGSKYAFLYSPDLLIQTTITGQLCLLMLIERITLAGGKVYSANTDGVVFKCNKSIYDEIDLACFDWELDTGLELEETRYKGLYSRDVNSYVAVKESGVKGKGAFADPTLSKNPQNEICIDAVKRYLLDGTPIEQSIRSCLDITKFLTVRSVTGGAVWRDQYLGKAVRFYYSKDGDTIHYKKNGNKVPKSDGSRPLMDLCESLPKDLDIDWYILEAKTMLKDLGC